MKTNKEYFENCKKENGSTMYKGIEYALIQQASIGNNNSYVAYGVSIEMLNNRDEQDREYDVMFDGGALITWDCSEWLANKEDEDQSNACDWDNASLITFK